LPSEIVSPLLQLLPFAVRSFAALTTCGTAAAMTNSPIATSIAGTAFSQVRAISGLRLDAMEPI